MASVFNFQVTIPDVSDVPVQMYFNQMLTPLGSDDEVRAGNLITALIDCGSLGRTDVSIVNASRDPDVGLTNMVGPHYKATLDTTVNTLTFTPRRGFHGTGSGKIRSGFFPARANGHFQRNDARVMVGSLSPAAAGALVDANSRTAIWPDTANVGWTVNCGVPHIQTPYAGDRSGVWLAQRTGQNALALYLENVLLAVSDRASVALTDDEIVYGHYHIQWMMEIGASLNDYQRVGSFNAWSAFRDGIPPE